MNEMRFKSSIAPKSMKKGLLISELCRVKNSSSKEENFERSLHQVKEKFRNLEYPKSLIESTILNFDENFTPKVDWKTEKLEHPLRNHTVKIPFTSARVEKICRKLKGVLKGITPEFNVAVANKTITIKSVLLSHLRSFTKQEDEINTIYKFSCECGDNDYIGETQRRLRTRVIEHGQRSRNSPVYEHITTCEAYQLSFHQTYGRVPTSRERIQFLLDHFKILHRNMGLYSTRTLIEALEISLNSPTLNAQIKHRKVCFV
jgi:hypothetical protein